MTVDITSTEGTDLLCFRAGKPGYVRVISADPDGDIPDQDLGAYRIVDLIRILEGFVPRAESRPASPFLGRAS